MTAAMCDIDLGRVPRNKFQTKVAISFGEVMFEILLTHFHEVFRVALVQVSPRKHAVFPWHALLSYSTVISLNLYCHRAIRRFVANFAFPPPTADEVGRSHSHLSRSSLRLWAE